MDKIKIIVIVLASVLVASLALVGININSYISSLNLQSNDSATIKNAFHDQGYIYMTPLEPTTKDKVSLKLRVPRYNITKAQIQYTLDDGASWLVANMSYDKVDESGYFDYWKGVIPPQNKAYKYRFICSNKKNTAYVTLMGANKREPQNTDFDFYVMPDFKTPNWTKGAVWYSIMPDAFYNGDVKNDRPTSGDTRENAWGNSHFGGIDWFGGDIKGVENKIDYIGKTLNANAVFMNPIWKTNHNAGYGSLDIQQVDQSIGTENDLVDLSKSLHGKDMKIMLDAVFKYYNQAGTWFNEAGIFPLIGAAQEKTSPFYDAFKFYKWPSQRETDWGQPVINFGAQVSRDFLYIKPNSVINLFLNEPYKIDGWRMDVGSTLWGNDRNENDILKDIRKYLKTTNPEAIFLSEHATDSDIYDYTLDSKWNYDYGYKVRDWSLGDRSQTVLDTQLAQSVRKLPRSIALSSYNFLTTHDLSRIGLNISDRPYLMNAAQVLTMTYLGAPSIYFGDEIGMPGVPAQGVSEMAPTSFSSFNWDKSTWDYQVFNMQRALGELRVTNEAFKLGIVKTILTDNMKKLYGFGRWDEKGKTITIVSQNDKAVKAEIDAYQVSCKDGTIFTDYLSGQKYKVVDGKINVNVLPGGAVLVTGDAGNFRDKYELMNIGKKSPVVMEGVNKFTLKGNGSLKGSNDSIMFAGTPVFNNFSIEAQISMDNSGKFALIARENNQKNGASYALEISNGEIKAVVRTKQGDGSKEIGKAKVAKGSFVKIVRGGNTFKTYVAENVKGKPGQYKVIERLTAQAEIGYSSLAGFASISGNSVIENLSVVKLDKQLSEDFNGSVLGAMLQKNGTGKFKLSDGKLSINVDKGLSSATSIAPLNDWSFKSKLTFASKSEGNFAGVFAMQNDKNFVSVARTISGNKSVISFGQMVDGKYVEYKALQESNSSKDIIVQLQRSGTRYSALYSYDGKEWISIGTGLFANYSDANVGIFVSGKVDAKFDYACFGNAIEDGKSENNSITTGTINVDYKQMVSVLTNGKYVKKSGDWSYSVGGLLQSNKAVEGRIDYTGKVLGNSKIAATLSITDGKGYAGIYFKKPTDADTISKGYFLKLNSDGNLVLLKNNSIVLGEAKLKDGEKNASFLIECLEDNIVIYYGKETFPIINVKDSTYLSGFAGFITSGVVAKVTNYNLFDYYSNWNVSSGTITSGSGGVIVAAQAQKDAIANLNGVAVTDVAMGFNLQLSQASSTSKGYAGVLLGTSSGYHPQQGGLLFSLDTAGNLSISEKSKTLKTTQIGGDLTSVYLVIVSQNGKYSVYLNDDKTPILVYSEKIIRSGVITLYAKESKAVFAKLSIYGLKNNEDFTKLPLYNIRQKALNMNAVATIVFTDNFNSSSSLENWIPYDGQWEIKEGAYYCTSASSWSSGTSTTSGKYKNFEMSFKLKVDGGAGFMSVDFRKKNSNDTHEMSGYMFYANSGAVAIYKNNKGELKNGGLAGWSNGQWADFKIVCIGGNITVYGNGQKIMEVSDASYTDGFISLNAGMATGAFDDVVIKPLG